MGDKKGLNIDSLPLKGKIYVWNSAVEFKHIHRSTNKMVGPMLIEAQRHWEGLL